MSVASGWSYLKKHRTTCRIDLFALVLINLWNRSKTLPLPPINATLQVIKPIAA